MSFRYLLSRDALDTEMFGYAVNLKAGYWYRISGSTKRLLVDIIC
jgi:hypothetical protein